MGKKISMLLYLLIVTILLSCGANDSSIKTPEPDISNVSKEKAPKYIFMFIGDGMSIAQVNATQIFNGNKAIGKISTENLLFSNFPSCGMATTHDPTSFCPDSASTATSLSTGYKTYSGVIGISADKNVVTNIAELLKEKGMKIGIISTVPINHATPAAYYAHVNSRSDYYKIAMQMAKSGFDYFAGGEIINPTGKDNNQPDAYNILKEDGYTIARTTEEISTLKASSGKCYAISPTIQDNGSMPYSIDQKEDDISLADLVKRGIDVLDNENGFFLMAEGGKIDWACHANDAMTAIKEVISFEEAVEVAYDFFQEHLDETLIIVTGDHETGGMTIGHASTGYTTALNILKNQKMSYVEFNNLIDGIQDTNPSLTFDDIIPVITESFGLKLSSGKTEENKMNPLVLTEYETHKLKAGFSQAMLPAQNREKTEETALLYGNYNPLSISITHIINNKAGIGWTSYAHTGVPVPVYACGIGSDLFNGYYDNTDVFRKLCEICEID